MLVEEKKLKLMAISLNKYLDYTQHLYNNARLTNIGSSLSEHTVRFMI